LEDSAENSGLSSDQKRVAAQGVTMRAIFAPILFGLVLTYGANDALAQKIWLLGEGTSSCGQRTQATVENDSVVHLQQSAWVLGYLRGVFDGLAVKPDPMAGLDSAAIREWLNNYCREHPLDTIYDAASVLGKDLIARSRAGRK
jgi:hypothetical protein